MNAITPLVCCCINQCVVQSEQEDLEGFREGGGEGWMGGDAAEWIVMLP